MLDLESEDEEIGFSTGPLPRQQARAASFEPRETGELDLEAFDDDMLGDVGEADLFDDDDEPDGEPAGTGDDLPALPSAAPASPQQPSEAELPSAPSVRARTLPPLVDPGELDLDYDASGPVDVEALLRAEAAARDPLGVARDDGAFEFTPAPDPSAAADAGSVGDLVDELAALLQPPAAQPAPEPALPESPRRRDGGDGPVARVGVSRRPRSALPDLPPPEPLDPLPAAQPSPQPAPPHHPSPQPALPHDETPAPAAAQASSDGPLVPIASAAEQAMEISTSGPASAPQIDGPALDLAIEPTPSVGLDPSGTLYEGPEVDDADGAALAAAADAKRLAVGATTPAQADAERPSVSFAAIDAAQDAFRAIDKAVKTTNLYDGRGDASKSAITAAHDLLKLALEHGAIQLRVTPYELLLDGEPIYTSEEERSGLTYRLFRDGVRELTLLPGFSEDELRQLVDVLRVMRPASVEEDTVTQLWECKLSSLRYRAIDIFLEGLLDSADSAFARSISALVEEAVRPLHGAAAVGERCAPMAPAQASASVPPTVMALEEDQALAAIQPAREALLDDTWQRAIAVYARLLRYTDDSGALAALALPIIEEMFGAGRFEALAAAIRAIDNIAASAGDLAEAARPLQQALRHLCLEGRLVELAGKAAVMTAEQFEPLAQIIERLPAEADRQLLQVLDAAPEGPLHDRLRAILVARGIDLSAYYIKQLSASSIAEAVVAVRALRAVGTKEAIAGLRSALSHESKQVPFEAASALRGIATVELAADLIGTLAQSTRQLRGAVFETLEGFDAAAARAHAPLLLDVLDDDKLSAWSRADRQRLLQLIVRWGGDDCNEHVLKTISSSNTFRRKRIEQQRQEMFEAVQRVGGKRAKRLLEACLQRRPPEAVCAGIESALRKLARTASGGDE